MHLSGLPFPWVQILPLTTNLETICQTPLLDDVDQQHVGLSTPACHVTPIITASKSITSTKALHLHLMTQCHPSSSIQSEFDIS